MHGKWIVIYIYIYLSRVLRLSQLYLEQDIMDLEKDGIDNRIVPPRVPDLLDVRRQYIYVYTTMFCIVYMQLVERV